LQAFSTGLPCESQGLQVAFILDLTGHETVGIQEIDTLCLEAEVEKSFKLFRDFGKKTMVLA
jgi:hypothetical protein